MSNLIEQHCKRCGESYDPAFGCRCTQLAIGGSQAEGRVQVPLTVSEYRSAFTSSWLASLITIEKPA